MTLTNLGMLEWSGGRENDMHRTYKAKFLVESDDEDDGPQSVTFCAGLPVIGSAWTYGNETDTDALCYPFLDCEAVIKREKNYRWILSYTFSTRPIKTCATTAITNPLSQPMVISGSFFNEQERVCKDVDDKAIISSSLEPIWVNKDKTKATVSITQTVASLGLSTFAPMINTLNDATLWGMAARCIKLRNVPWRRLVWGVCTYYYERTLEFQVDPDTFDETKLLDQGHRWLDPDKLLADPGLNRQDPNNFVRACDFRGNPNRLVLLNNNGEKNPDPANQNFYRPTVELYSESNFLTLGVPVSL